MVSFDSVKIIMNWDIKPGRDQDYFEFVVRDFVPSMTKLGLEITDGWYTIYSADDNQPQILAAGIMDNLNAMQQVLDSDEWAEMHDQLLDYVDNYQHKIVRVSGGFQF
ncbi:MAG: hypothetical protein AAF125_02755 [Chloroflexota bacterium]